MDCCGSDYDEQIGVSAGPECKKELQEITKLAEEGLVANSAPVKSMFSEEKVQYGRSDNLCAPLLEAVQNKTDLLRAFANLLSLNRSSVELYDANELKRRAEANDIGAINSMSYAYQVCTELAAFHVSPANDSIRLDLSNSSTTVLNCFGHETFPDVKASKENYGGWDISGSMACQNKLSLLMVRRLFQIKLTKHLRQISDPEAALRTS
ncbi:hypothetical protein SELMODRAFT_420262 [Selaginella moellendorffii]|uniref:Uncharacterized protein n=1 Tax=Selaginella moellendorffii TaxID=88036 RepID=D8SBF8_SELML|nr:hypothetical protein SELMODRAFT_420262 [Selaginella moellendorffii]